MQKELMYLSHCFLETQEGNIFFPFQVPGIRAMKQQSLQPQKPPPEAPTSQEQTAPVR